MTNKDLYPDESYNFVFGLARLGGGTGVFSFVRYAPSFPGNRPSSNWIESACHTMAHEITHMFGLKHCIYYECLMNGVMSADEAARRPNHTLCPVCLKKLKINIKFDTAERFKLLMTACLELGLTREAQKY